MLLLFILCFLRTEQHYLQDLLSYNETVFQSHINGENQFLGETLASAIDVLLIHHTNKDHHLNQQVCQVNQRSLHFETQRMIIINEGIGLKYKFDPLQPLNVSQFISMTHIKDGLIALTSDNKIYIALLDYDKLHSNTFNVIDDETQNHFASIVKVIDLPTHWSHNKAQLPNLVFQDESNSVLLVYNDLLQIALVDQILADYINFEVQDEWLQRQIRGLTKTFKKYIYSAVGADGLDIYYYDGKMSFVMEYSIEELFGIGYHLIEDFSFCDTCCKQENCLHIYFMVKNFGICIFEITFLDLVPTFKLLFKNIGEMKGGISLDQHQNGKYIIAVYKQNNRFLAIQYFIDYQQQKWQVIGTYYSRSKIIDVKINEDFALLQGINDHQVIFYGVDQRFLTYSERQPNYINEPGLKQFDFFRKEMHTKASNLPTSSQFQFDDFFYGISQQHLFVTRYRLKTPNIYCYKQNTGFFGDVYEYTLLYNNTKCDEDDQLQKGTIDVCNKQIDFSVEFVMTYFYQTSESKILIIISLTSGLFLLLTFLCIFFARRSYLKKKELLNKKIESFQYITPKARTISDLPSRMDYSIVRNDQSMTAKKIIYDTEQI